ncbi:phage minor capsid protein [Streptosporangium sp. CA-135522]|uniref:phage minor capsid protein n=1 Tax=Streptosporangium sp. CA-135522 TaxID=3240072 RepID=UPI003D9192DE
MADALEAVDGRIELAYAISEMYADAEEHLFKVLAKATAKGAQPQQAANRLTEIKELSEQAEKILKDLEKLASQMLSKGVTQAWEDGFEQASQELERLGEDRGITPGQGVAQLLKEALGLLPPLTTGALRMVNDIYRQVIAETTPLALTGAITRQQATTAALQKFAAKGISGFVDKKNRTWSISAYAEMAARTAMARAANEGHLSTLRDNGRDLVIVSRAPYRCPVCVPWEGKVLSQAGSAGDRQETNVLTGELVTVQVTATVEDARQAGLQHPNCRHTFSVYLPGLTKPPPKVETAGMYEDSQEQRRLERQIRGWKRRAAAAPEGSPEKKAANQHLKAYQAKMREHLDKTGLLR